MAPVEMRSDRSVDLLIVQASGGGAWRERGGGRELVGWLNGETGKDTRAERSRKRALNALELITRLSRISYAFTADVLRESRISSKLSVTGLQEPSYVGEGGGVPRPLTTVERTRALRLRLLIRRSTWHSKENRVNHRDSLSRALLFRGPKRGRPPRLKRAPERHRDRVLVAHFTKSLMQIFITK